VANPPAACFSFYVQPVWSLAPASAAGRLRAAQGVCRAVGQRRALPGQAGRSLIALLAVAGLALSAAPAARADQALPPSAIQALGGHLAAWQVQWLETGGTSGVPAADAAQGPAAPDTANAAYLIDGYSVVLRNGQAEGPASPGSAFVVSTRLEPPGAVGDLDGDGLPDAAAVVEQSGKGGGADVYVAALFGSAPAGPAPTVLLGADVTVQWVGIAQGQIIVADLPAAGSGPAALPTVEAFTVVAGTLLPDGPPAAQLRAWQPTGFQASSTRAGSCTQPSVAAPRAGAFRCTLAGGVLDPCFALPGSQAACPAGDPGAQSGVAVSLPGPLPAGSGLAPSPARAWAFTLEGGGFCTLQPGSALPPDHPYSCTLPAGSATAPVYGTSPAAAQGGVYTTRYAPVTPSPASGGQPSLGSDTAAVVAVLWL